MILDAPFGAAEPMEQAWRGVAEHAVRLEAFSAAFWRAVTSGGA